MKKTVAKLDAVVLGEILHVVNNQLNVILFQADFTAEPHAESIRKSVMTIARYIQSLEDREHFDSGTFEYSDHSKRSA